MIILDTRKNAIVGCTDYQLPVTRLGEAQGRRRYDISKVLGGLWALEWEWHFAELNLRCAGFSRFCMLKLN